MNENISDNVQSAYELAKYYREQGDNKNAGAWALKAMELGCQKEAPELLAKIAHETKSKNAAITLSGYYWSRKDIREAEKWAILAKKFGSTRLAQARLDEIVAYREALELQLAVENFSPPVDESPSLKKRK